MSLWARAALKNEVLLQLPWQPIVYEQIHRRKLSQKILREVSFAVAMESYENKAEKIVEKRGNIR